MITKILRLEEGNPAIKEIARYTLPPKQALVCFIEQFLRCNNDTSNYPEQIEGMRESGTVSNHWYYDVPRMTGNGIRFDTILAAYPADTFVMGA